MARSLLQGYPRCTGSGSSSELGNGATSDLWAPTASDISLAALAPLHPELWKSAGNLRVVQVSLGYKFTCILLNSGMVRYHVHGASGRTGCCCCCWQRSHWIGFGVPAAALPAGVVRRQERPQAVRPEHGRRRCDVLLDAGTAAGHDRRQPSGPTQRRPRARV